MQRIVQRQTYLNLAMNWLSVKPSVYSPMSMVDPILIDVGTVASIRASKLSKFVALTISVTSDSVALLCLGANLQRERKRNV